MTTLSATGMVQSMNFGAAVSFNWSMLPASVSIHQGGVRIFAVFMVVMEWLECCVLSFLLSGSECTGIPMMIPT